MTARPSTTYRAARRNSYYGRGLAGELNTAYRGYSPFSMVRNQRRFHKPPVVLLPSHSAINRRGELVPPRSYGSRSAQPGALKPHFPPPINRAHPQGHWSQYA